MSGTLVSLAAGVLLGLSLAAPPGPMNAVIAEESVLRGWIAGFWAGLGAMSADACFFLVALAGVVAVLRDAPLVRRSMLAVGGLLMLYFAVGAARGAGSAYAGDADAAGRGQGFRKAFALALTNPFQILWWLTVGATLLDPGTVEVGAGVVVETGNPAIVVGFFAGIGVWIVAFPAALVALGARIDRFAPAVAGASALVLAGFGALFLTRATGLA